MAAQERQARGLDLHRLGADQGQDQVDVVDHEVQDDADIGRAEGEAGGPHGVDEPGRAEVRQHGREGRVEAFDVADLEDAVMAAGRLDQLVGLGQRGGQGLFDQEVGARLQKLCPC